MAKIKKRKITTARVSARAARPLAFSKSLYSNNVSQMVIGAAAGCVLGAAAAYFLTPQNARHKLTRGLDDIYDKISDVAEEYTHGAIEKGQNVYSSAKDTMENIYEAAANAFSRNGKISNKNLVLGILGAGLLGASAVYFAAQNSSKQGIMGQLKAGKWSDIAQNVIETVSDKLHEKEGSHAVQNVMDWASMGLNLWQEIKKRR